METAGFVIGGTALASLFSDCLTIIDRIDSGRNSSKAYQDSALQIAMLGVRLQRIRTAIEGNPDQNAWTQSQGEEAKAWLTCVRARLAEAEAAGERYELASQPAPSEESESSKLAAITDKLRKTFLENREGLPLSQALRWSLHDEKKLQNLVTTLTAMITSLEAIFPTLAPALDRLATQQKTLLSQQIDEPELLQHVRVVAGEVDERVPGHIYRNMTTSENATLTVGNYVSEEYAKSGAETSRGSGHSYNNIVSKGQAQVFTGDIYGGPSPFEGLKVRREGAGSGEGVHLGDTYGGKSPLKEKVRSEGANAAGQVHELEGSQAPSSSTKQ